MKPFPGEDKETLIGIHKINIVSIFYNSMHSNHIFFPFSKVPTTPDEWRTIANGFEKWNFPHCIGAVDGKHVLIRAPSNQGSYFFNYKGSHSIVLMAVVNANYEFIYVDVGANGRVSDGGVWANTTLSRHLEEGTAGLPEPDQVQGSQRTLPYVFVGDDAFPLKQYLMKPYPNKNQDEEQRIFSYRLSRARRIVENAFGIMASRFRILQSAIQLMPDKVVKIVLACTALHNYLRKNHEAFYTPVGSLDRENITDGTITPGSWRDCEQLLPLERLRRNTTNDAKNIRKDFATYFSNEGAVPWQRRVCGLEELQ